MYDYAKLITSRRELEMHYYWNQMRADLFESKALLALHNDNYLDFKMFANIADGYKLRVKELRKIKVEK